RASLVNELASFVAESDRVDDRASLAAMDAERYTNALERSVATTTSTDTDVHALAEPFCVEQIYADDAADTPSLDGAQYSLSYDCSTEVWVVAALTYDHWADTRLGYF